MNSKLKILIELGLLVVPGLGLGSAHAQVQEAWVATYNGSVNAIALDKAGNIYVAVTSGDIITIKYDLDGNQLWVARYNGPGNGWDVARGLAVDTDGNVYVAGSSQGVGTDYDIVTMKYNGNGNQIWVDRYDRSAIADHAFALALDDSQSVYVAGTETIKYASDGTRLWVVPYNGVAPYYGGFATRVAPDNAGNVYVAGTSGGSNGFSDFATIKYDAAGKELWATRYDGPVNQQDIVKDMAVDRAGNAFTAVPQAERILRKKSVGFRLAPCDRHGHE